MSKNTVFMLVLAALVAGAVMGGFSVASAVDSATSSTLGRDSPVRDGPGRLRQGGSVREGWHLRPGHDAVRSGGRCSVRLELGGVRFRLRGVRYGSQRRVRHGGVPEHEVAGPSADAGTQDCSGGRPPEWAVFLLPRLWGTNSTRPPCRSASDGPSRQLGGGGPRVGDVVVGTCSWTDKTMIERWYPRGVLSRGAAALLRRALRHGRGRLDLLRYAAPEYATAGSKRTPPGFTFHVKAYGMMTGHEVDERALHPELR